MNRDFLSIAELNKKELWDLLMLAKDLKVKKFSNALEGKTVGLVLQKPSTRTSVSFAVGVAQLGGHPLLLNADALQINRGESPKDTARALSRYLDAIVIRTAHHLDVVEMAEYASIPVINGLTDKEHPCQTIADLLTIIEHKDIRRPKEFEGLRLGYLGDANNVANSLVLAASLLQMKITLASPRGYELKPDVLKQATRLNSAAPRFIKTVRNPVEAATGADILYTDVWTSMGQEAESRKRRKVFAPFQLNKRLLLKAKKNALVMHCLPAHRGEEITEEVFEGPNSVVFDQAENRLHIQKAILKTLLGRRS